MGSLSENMGLIRSLGFDQPLLPAVWGHRPDPTLLSGAGLDPLGDSKAEPVLRFCEGPDLPIECEKLRSHTASSGQGGCFQYIVFFVLHFEVLGDQEPEALLILEENLWNAISNRIRENDSEHCS